MIVNMALLEMLTSSGLGAALGGIGAIAEKVIMRRMDAKDKADERTHVFKMHNLQMQMDQNKADNDLVKEETKGDYAGLLESIKHDMSVVMSTPDKLLETHPKLGGFVVLLQTIANFTRSLFRPFLTVFTWYLAKDAGYPPELVAIASTCTTWWLGSRNGSPAVRNLRNPR